jgi:antitoxin component YwqK of YwqJK toxin-antitoxin module
MDPYNIIKFISKNRPDHYPMDKIRKDLKNMIKPVNGNGYEDENGMQGMWQNKDGDIFTYINNKREGDYYLYNRHDHKLNEKGTYVNGRKNGPFETYYNGKILQKGTYVNGEKNGEYKTYRIDGKILEKGTYVNGEKNGLFITYYRIDGKILEKGTYVNGEKNGSYESYTDEGRLFEKGTYANNKKNGLFITYYRDGSVEEKTYIDDREEIF